MKRPNIVLIMSDQHNKNAMGCSGDTLVSTPNLDKMAKEGVRFTNTYCSSPLCVPSRKSFLTSRFPSDQRVWSNSCTLNNHIPTFAHSLTNAGYETVLCGRMHLVSSENHGFEKTLVGDVTAQYPGTETPILAPFPGGANGQTRIAVEFAGGGSSAFQQFDLDCVKSAKKYLKNRTDKRPFCLVIGFMLPHNPLVCPKELFEKYYDKMTMPKVKHKEKNIHPALIKWLKLRGLEKELSKEQILRARAAYYGLIEYMDARVGEVRKALAESGALKDTVFIYTSDHGDMNGEHEMWWKSTLYDGSAGVPLIISCPGKFAKGRVVKQNTNLMDIGPTLIEVANGRQLPRSRGNSLLPFLKKGSMKVSKWKNETYCENTTKYCMEEGATESPSRMIRSGKWKLNYYMGYKNPQLFDMEKDPNETNDLANMPKYKNLRKRLLKKVLKDWDGEFIMREQAKLLEDILPILDQWGKIVKPKGKQWKAPENANKMLDI